MEGIGSDHRPLPITEHKRENRAGVAVNRDQTPKSETQLVTIQPLPN